MVANNNKIAILITAYNRPDKIQALTRTLSRYQLRAKFYFSIDGPKKNDEEGIGRRDQVISILEDFETSHDVVTEWKVNNTNLGCRRAMEAAITWFFENENEGIILEDDCIPSESFFSFCSSLLTKYRDNDEILHINGSNFQQSKRIGESSYYFSALPHLWGWATWRRAWNKYSGSMDLSVLSDLKTYIPNQDHIEYYRKEFELTKKGKRDSWGYRWTLSIWKEKGICITPNQNLVSNIGFGQDSTHTTQTASQLSEIPLKELLVPIKHPQEIKINQKADDRVYKLYHKPRTQVLQRVKKVLLNPLRSHFPASYTRLLSVKNRLFPNSSNGKHDRTC